jgi:hypothetical protein
MVAWLCKTSLLTAGIGALVTGLCWVIVVFDGYDLIVYGSVLPRLLTEPGWGLTVAGAACSAALHSPASSSVRYSRAPCPTLPPAAELAGEGRVSQHRHGPITHTAVTITRTGKQLSKRSPRTRGAMTTERLMKCSLNCPKGHETVLFSWGVCYSVS